MDRVDVLRMAWVGLDFLPKPGDVDVHGSGKDHSVVSPYRIEELIARESVPAVFDEMAQQFEFAKGEFQRLSMPENFRAAEINHDIPKLKNSLR